MKLTNRFLATGAQLNNGKNDFGFTGKKEADLFQKHIEGLLVNKKLLDGRSVLIERKQENDVFTVRLMIK